MHALLTTPQLLPAQGAPRPKGAARGPELEQLVSSCVRDAGGDPVAAALLLEDRIKEHSALMVTLVQPYLADACWKAVQKRLDMARGASDEPEIVQQSPDTSARLHALADSLLDFRLPNGVLLRDAFSEDLRAAAHWYLSRAHSFGRRGKWLEAVAVQVPRYRVAGDVLDEQQLQELLDSVTYRMGRTSC